MTAAALLGRLQAVRQTAPGRWLARCPAHEDRTPSLSIRELADGTILLKDFAGCGAADIVAAVGLGLKDLFPERPADHRCRPTNHRLSAVDVLTALDHEVHVVAIIGADMLEHRLLEPDVWDRLTLWSVASGTPAPP